MKIIHALQPNFFKTYLILSSYLCLFLGPKRDEMIEGWREPKNKKIYNLPSSPNITTVIMSRTWAAHLARMGRRGIHVGFWWINQKEVTAR
jgi:hypothetical protein